MNLPAFYKYPEEIELEKKLANLASLNLVLVEWEAELVSLRTAMSAFNVRCNNHRDECASRERLLNEIRLQITVLELDYIATKDSLNVKAEIRQRFTPQSKDVAGERAKHQKDCSSDDAEQQGSAGGEHEDFDEHEDLDEEYEESPSRKEKTDGEVKSQYRAVAKMIHPDLATCEEERLHREMLMKELNSAYSDNDINKISDVFVAWNESIWCIQITGVAGKLVQTIRRIAHTQREIDRIQTLISGIRNGSDYEFWQNMEYLTQNGVYIWQEELDKLEVEIADARSILSKLTRKIERLKYEAAFKSMRTGTAEVTKVARVVYEGVIYIRCTVIGGKLIEGAIARVHRDDKVILNGNIESIRFQDCVVQEVCEGIQCALHIPNYSPMADDLIECVQLQRRRSDASG